MIKDRTYMCIDMKSFFASVECVERGLNPMTTNLVVADSTRGTGTICLAVSPSMKALGVKNRCRVFQIPKNIEYITAPPRMQKYIDYAAEIYGIYLEVIDKDDIHVYSIDESFIDVTDYLVLYKKTAREFAKQLTGEIARRLGIPATVGIGTNLYLAKIALDITAKKSPEHIGYLDEATYIETLSHHRPITDFWGIAGGTARRLEKYGIFDMAGVAKCPEDLLYREFGVNAELIIDHSHGKESCLMRDIKNYKTKSRSISNSQILFRDYTAEEARLVVEEMVRSGCQELMRRGVITDNVNLYVGYSGRDVDSVHAHKRMNIRTNLPQKIMPFVMELYDKKVDKSLTVRRLGIGFDDVVDSRLEGYDLFTDIAQVEKEKSVSKTILDLQQKFGRNAVVMASDLQSHATLMERNRLIGGHRANDES
ncbi:MAG: DNA repair protein [Clostridiales bacterium]|nr:DNA repair protein [Clostridiales bacterium]